MRSSSPGERIVPASMKILWEMPTKTFDELQLSGFRSFMKLCMHEIKLSNLASSPVPNLACSPDVLHNSDREDKARSCENWHSRVMLHRSTILRLILAG